MKGVSKKQLALAVSKNKLFMLENISELISNMSKEQFIKSLDFLIQLQKDEIREIEGTKIKVREE